MCVCGYVCVWICEGGTYVCVCVDMCVCGWICVCVDMCVCGYVREGHMCVNSYVQRIEINGQ